MKKTILSTFFALCILPTTLCADPIDLTKAKDIASAYMCEGQDPELVETTVSKRLSDNDNQSVYIFNRGNDQGFVIISGDDCLPTVLGYTESGEFNTDQLPPALLNWIEYYSDIITQAQAQGATARVAKRATSTKKTISPLLTCNWNQSWPYNALCPYLTGSTSQSITGCVATAASQVLYYWRNDLNPFTQYDTPTYSYGDAPVTESIPAGTALQWELMQDTHSSSTPDDMNTAAARLNSVVGTSTWLTYGSSTSGQIYNLVYTFSAQFLMNSTCTYKSGYSETAWANLVYSDLEKGWPIVYSGVDSSNSGHAVVVDGYRATDDLFHFNFGWGGSGNGYYTVDDETGMNGFNSSQGMTHTIHPKATFITGSLKTTELYARMANTVEIEITNTGTPDYSGIYLYASRKEGAPTSIDDASKSDTETTISKDQTATISLSYTPSSTSTLYIYVMDRDANILDQAIITPQTQAPELELNNFGMDSGSNSMEEIINVDGTTQTITYNNIYAGEASAIAYIANTDNSTPGNPTLTCTLYQYNTEQATMSEVTSLTDRNTIFNPGEQYNIEFNLGSLDTDVLYAACLSRNYKCASTTYIMETNTDTIVYFKMQSADLTLTQTNDNYGAVLTGHWNSQLFAELAETAAACYYDLTEVDGVDDIPETDNPNTLFYVASDANATGTNIIKDGTCQELSLTYGYDFVPQSDFTALKVTFNPQTTSSDWKCIVVPFNCEVPAGSRARRITAITNKLISGSDEVNTTMLSCTPYLYKTATPGADRITAENVTVSIDIEPDCAEQLLPTFVNLTAQSGQRILNSTSFTESIGSTISAFSGYMDYTTDISISIYSYSSKDQTSDELSELIAQATEMAETYADRLTEENLETFTTAIQTAAQLYTEHPDEDDLESMATTLEEAMNECLLNIIVTNDPTDVTNVYLTNSSFETRRTTGWTITKETGQTSKVMDVASDLEDYMVDADGTYVFYSYSNSGAGSVTLSQTAEGLKEGFYRVKAWLATDDGESVVLFAGNETATMTADGRGERYMMETTIDSIYVEEGGALEIGVQSNTGWYKADNFKLFYLGDESTTTAIEMVRETNKTNDIKAYGGTGCIVIESTQQTDIHIYSIDGSLIDRFTVNGRLQISGFNKGIYIVNHTKVIVK